MRWYTFLFTIFLFSISCKEDDPVSTSLFETPDWTDATHGKLNSPNYNVVFPQQTVNRIDVTIETPDWQAMQTDLQSKYGGNNQPGPSVAGEPNFIPCTFRFNEKNWYKVGIRYKGNSSLKSSYNTGIKKLPLKFDFDQFEDTYPEIKNQRFYGFKQLSFSNGFDDKSLIREKITADLFRAAGVHAPQTAFYRVYVDYGEGSKYFGLYTAVEVVDDTMIKNQFSDQSGNLYKPDGQGASFALNSFNKNNFEKKTNESTDWNDVLDLYNALHASSRTTDASVWMNNLETELDVNGFLKWLAVNTVIQNWDTYGKMTHNYYLYADPAFGNRFTWIPWDNNEALAPGKMGGALSLSLAEVGNGWPLIRYIIDQPLNLAQYKKFIAEFIDGAFKPESVQAEFDRLKDLIKPYVVGLEGESKPYSFLNSSSEFETAFSTLSIHVNTRFTAAYDFIK